MILMTLFRFQSCDLNAHLQVVSQDVTLLEIYYAGDELQRCCEGV